MSACAHRAGRICSDVWVGQWASISTTESLTGAMTVCRIRQSPAPKAKYPVLWEGQETDVNDGGWQTVFGDRWCMASVGSDVNKNGGSQFYLSGGRSLLDRPPSSWCDDGKPLHGNQSSLSSPRARWISLHTTPTSHHTEARARRHMCAQHCLLVSRVSLPQQAEYICLDIDRDGLV